MRPATKSLHWAGKLLALLVLASTSVFAASVVLGTWLPKSTIAVGALIAFFVCAPIGALWMLYDCSVREKPPFIYFLMAVVPYAFVWYYIERVRPRRNRGADQNGRVAAP